MATKIGVKHGPPRSASAARSVLVELEWWTNCGVWMGPLMEMVNGWGVYWVNIIIINSLSQWPTF